MDIKRIILMIITFALGAVLLVFIFMDAANDRARDAAKQEAEINARTYEIQIQKLEVEILEKERAIAATPDHGRAVVGFHISRPEDVTYAVSMGERYGFKPTGVINCTRSTEELLAIADALQAAGHPLDIMLTGTPFSEEVNANANMLLAELPARDFSRGISFLLRSADDSEENRSVILDGAYSGYSFYSENGASGTLPSGTPYIAYSFLHTNDYNMSGIMRTIRNAKTSMIIVVDLEAVAQGTVNEETARGWIERVVEERDKESFEVCSVDDAFGELRRLRAEYDASVEEYENFKAEKEAEIAALKEKVAEIKK